MASRVAIRSSLALRTTPVCATRNLHLRPSGRLEKSATDTVKDAAKTVDRTVADAAVKGIDKGQQAAESLKQSAGMTSAEAKKKAEEAKGVASGKTEEMKGTVKGKAEEAKAKMDS